MEANLTRTHQYRRLLILIGGAVAGAAVFFAALRLVLPASVASSFAIGLGVGGAVYLDRRFFRLEPGPAVEGFLYGAATALGWAGAQAVSMLLS